jgi:phosphohistidine phosphatase
MVTRRLHLLRHAKSAWDDRSLDDHDRPLAPRGRVAARRLARRAAELGLRPDLVVCSSATRARQTLDLLAPSLGEVEIVVDGAVYQATAAELTAIVRDLPDERGEALVVGHNPGLQDLCLLLGTPSPERARVAERFPTCALATLELEGSWSDAAPASAVLVAFLTPRDLA